jgi:hypothetical protein
MFGYETAAGFGLAVGAAKNRLDVIVSHDACSGSDSARRLPSKSK